MSGMAAHLKSCACPSCVDRMVDEVVAATVAAQELDPLVEVDRIKRRVRDSLYWVEQEPGISVEVVVHYRMPVDASSVIVDFHVC